MTSHAQSSTLLFTILRRAGFALALLYSFTAVVSQSAQAQTFTVLYSFTGAGYDAFPIDNLAMDGGANLYGTSGFVAYKLERRGWVLDPLFTFLGGSGGTDPEAGLVIGPEGRLYGTNEVNGGDGCDYQGCGVVFNLTPPSTVPPDPLVPWNENVMYTFQGPPNDGQWPIGNLVFDATGAAYGTTILGGTNQSGTVYKLVPSGGSWSESVLYSFRGRPDGSRPYGSVAFDNAGNMYGTTLIGGQDYNEGTVWELTPMGSGWTETVIHDFTSSGGGTGPVGGLVRDSSGNLYGATGGGGAGGSGTIFELSPAGDQWNYTVLYSFTGSGGPAAPLTIDAVGNLYGTTAATGLYDNGVVFKLSPSAGGGWTYSVLHNFTGGTDGGYPRSQLLIDGRGDLYGTTYNGGDLSSCGGYGCGVVFEITL
jgi:uncharacterized repeat protein (TIGR03803 family)